MPINKKDIEAKSRALSVRLSNDVSELAPDIYDSIEQILQDEIDREVICDLAVNIVELERSNGISSFIFFHEHDFYVNGNLRTDIIDWLAFNLEGRFTIHNRNYFFVKICFDTDKEAATLFKLFWL